MLKQLLFAGFFLFSTIVFAQCPTTPIVLTSQAEVDSFFTTYLGCTELENSLTISGADITDLTPLNGITTVNGSVLIVDNSLLTNLDGLETLTTVPIGAGLFAVENNPLLENILGLSGLTGRVGQSLQIQNNPSLISLQGLENVTGPGDDDFVIINNDLLVDLTGLNGAILADDIVINDNENLVNLNGLDLFESTGDIIMRNNPNLLNLDGMPNLVQIFGLVLTDNVSLQNLNGLGDAMYNAGAALEITGNLSLDTCNAPMICDYLVVADPADTIIIENNASGCDSREEVEEACTVCPTGDIDLSSQAEVDTFRNNFRFCDTIDGVTLTVSGSDITDLSGLSDITTVINNGVLWIANNPNLVTTSGLGPITFDNAGLVVANNAALASLSLFEGNTDEFGLTIFGNASLTDISGLSGITGTRELRIIGNGSLTNLVGLENLTDIIELIEIQDNPLLADLTDLSGLVGDYFELYIDNNDSLIDLSGLEGLTGLTSIEFSISGNDNLVSLNGLQNFTNEAAVSSLLFQITDNASLTDISAISNILAETVSTLFIENNPALAVCNNDFVCSYLDSEGFAVISGNATGCNSQAEVEDSCGLSVADFALNSLNSLFPNPAESSVNVYLGDNLLLQEIKIFNLLGQQVGSFYESNFDVSGLEYGMYFVQISTDQGAVTKRLIKQ